MSITRLVLAAGLSAMAMTLGGCWGGDDDTATVPPPRTAVPDSAGASAAAFVSFLMTLVASDESSEPLTIPDTFAVPPEESAEPIPLV